MTRLAATLAALALLAACPKKEADKATPSTSSNATADAGAAASATPPATGGKLQLPVRPPPVGTVLTMVDAMDSKMDADAGGQKFAITQVGNKRTRIEILGVSGDAISKIRITYTERTETKTVNGKEESKPNPIAGHTYVVEAADGKIVVQREDGTPEPAELIAVEQDQKRLGAPDRMNLLLASRALAVGESMVLDKDQLAALNDDESNRVIEGTLTLGEVKDGIARFDLKMTMESGDPNLKITIPLTGAIVVDAATGWPQEMRMQGPLAGVGKGVTLTGTFTTKKTFAYGK
jgi:hypothetical protein